MKETPQVFIDRGKNVCGSRALSQYYGIEHDLAISRLQAALDIDPDCDELFWEPNYSEGETKVRFLLTFHGAAVYFAGEDGVPTGKFEALARAFGHVFDSGRDVLLFGQDANGVRS